jgi:hypothetical protein
MSSWRDWLRGKPKPDKVPGWASFFSPDQYALFHHLIDEHFQTKRQPITWGDGVLVLKPDDPAGLHQLGLVNLAQLCARNGEDDWASIINDHFNTLDKSQTEQRVLEQRLPDFERVRDLISVRLWPEDYLKELDVGRMIHRRDVPGAISALVYDLPSSIRNVTPEEADSWGIPIEKLFDIALENVRETCIPDVSEQDLGDGLSVHMLSDESFFVASHALTLEDHYPQFIGSFGALVGIPHRHVLLSYPINDLSVLQAIPKLIAVILGMERDGPGSISPRIYWLQHGEFVDLPYRVEDNTLNFAPPESFLEMLSLLSEGESDSDSDADEE